MMGQKLKSIAGSLFLILFAVSFCVGSPLRAQAASPPQASPNWESKARLHRLFRSARGSLILSERGIEFRRDNENPLVWSYGDLREIRLLTPRQLTLTSYENRSWHRGGDRQFRFDLDSPMPPGVAVDLIARVEKPSINGVPDPQEKSFATIPARRRTRTGGSNGVLRLREDGLDYVASRGRDSRRWRWGDIQTLAMPAPYQLRVGGYLETFEFELKGPLPQSIFERVWNRLYMQQLNLEVAPKGGSDAQ